MISSSIRNENPPHLQMASMSCSTGSLWNPTEGAFIPCGHFSSSFPAGGVQQSSSLTVLVRRPLVTKLTKDIVETYRICNPAFKYSEALKPKRFLTSPSLGVQNDGFDNVNSDLILSVNFVLVKNTQQRYIVKEILGHGTFGQVAKCQASENGNYVAVKIIKNQPAYYQQALVELSILTMLNSKFDPDDKSHIVRMLDYFVFKRHLCITFELLGSNLFELIKLNSFKGLPLSIIQLFSKQILHALVVLKEAGIIHCDLKPENILISTRANPAEIKIIDFGSACLEDRTVYSYIQSRYYRSPEVLLGYPYTTAIDMWSFGCIIAELFLGLPLFPGASEFDLLKRMIEILREQPPDHILRVASNTNKFFKVSRQLEGDNLCCGGSAYRLLTEEEYEVKEKKKPVIGKQYFNFASLEDIVKNYPYRKSLSKEEISRENVIRIALIDFLRGLVEFDPVKRWSPSQAARHPFVSGEPFTCPYTPLPETPRIPVSQNILVNQKPGGQHWFPAGLSPQVGKVNKSFLLSSPNCWNAPFSAGSYGSFGSYGSCNDGVGVGGSYGSYGDNHIHSHHPAVIGSSGMSIQAQGGGSMLGASPDAARWRTYQCPNSNGFGVSPSTSGTMFRPMSLGPSPSQFMPPTSQVLVVPGSPGKYAGQSSPARGSSIHGSPLGKASTIGQFNRRWSVGYSPGTLSMHHQESSVMNQHWQGNHLDCFNFTQPEGNAGGHLGSPHGASTLYSWRTQKEPSERTDCSTSTSPDPGDWDPNYSDELLLQEDASEINCLATGISNGMRLGKPMVSTLLSNGVGRFNHGGSQPPAVGILANSRRHAGVHFFSQARGSPNSLHETHVTGHTPRFPLKQPAIPNSMLPHQFMVQNSPSRFSLQQLQTSFAVSDHNQGHTTFVRGHATPGYNTAGPLSPKKSTTASGTSWDRTTGQPVMSVLPFPTSRKDYGRFA